MKTNAPPKQTDKPANKHRLYIFGVTFLAALVIALICWPTKRPSYRSAAIIAVDQPVDLTNDQEMFAVRLKETIKDVLSTQNLQPILASIKETTDTHKQSSLLAGADLEKLRSHLEIGVGKGNKQSQQLASVALTGNGTRDEVEFVNCLAGQLIESLKTFEPVDNRFAIEEIQRQFEISQARQRGLRNAANLIADQNVKKLNVFKTLELELDEPVHQVSNPAWQAYRERLEVLGREESALKAGQNEESEVGAEANLIQIREEVRFLKSQFALEPEILTFNLEQQSEVNSLQDTKSPVESLPAVTEEDYSSDAADGPKIQKNRFYATEPAAPQPTVSSTRRVKLVDHQKVSDSHDTVGEINAQIRMLENEQSRLQTALADQKSQPQPKSTELMRLAQPALKAKPLGSGVTRNQLMMMLMISLGFASLITLKAGSIAAGTAFHSAEEVARKLHIAVVGIVPVGNSVAGQSRQKQMTWLKRIIFGCEFTLIGFSIIMLALTIINSDISVAIRENPFVGVMEAVRLIKPW